MRAEAAYNPSVLTPTIVRPVWVAGRADAALAFTIPNAEMAKFATAAFARPQ